MSILHSAPFNISSLPALSPLTITTPLSTLLTHLTTQPVHATYYPFLRVGVLHAFRVALVWAGLTKGKDRRSIGRLGDLFGYLCLAWGGGTINSLLLSQPPIWLSSSTPWQIYPLLYFLLIPTGLSNFITTQTPPLLITTLNAFSDAITRGSTISSIPILLSTTSNPNLNGLWTRVLLSGISVCGGGWIVQTLGLDQPEWEFGVPGIMRSFVGGLHFWVGMGLGGVHAVLGGHEETRGVGNVLRGWGLGSKEMKVDDMGRGVGVGGLVDSEVARAVVVGLLFVGIWINRVLLSGVNGARIMGRVKKTRKVVKTTEVRVLEKGGISTPVRASRGKTPVKETLQVGDGKSSKKEKAVSGTPITKVVKSPIAAVEGQMATPRKSLRAKSRS